MAICPFRTPHRFDPHTQSPKLSISSLVVCDDSRHLGLCPSCGSPVNVIPPILWETVRLRVTIPQPERGSPPGRTSGSSDWSGVYTGLVSIGDTWPSVSLPPFPPQRQLKDLPASQVTLSSRPAHSPPTDDLSFDPRYFCCLSMYYNGYYT